MLSKGRKEKYRKKITGWGCEGKCEGDGKVVRRRVKRRIVFYFAFRYFRVRLLFFWNLCISRFYLRDLFCRNSIFRFSDSNSINHEHFDYLWLTQSFVPKLAFFDSTWSSFSLALFLWLRIRQMAQYCPLCLYFLSTEQNAPYFFYHDTPNWWTTINALYVWS